MTYESESTCGTAGWHIHPEYEMVYIKNGSGVLRIGTKSRPYVNGALIFLAGNIPHSDFGNKDKKTNKEVVIQFTKEFVKEKLAIFPELKSIKRFIEMSRYVLIFDNEVKESLGVHFETISQLSNQEKLIRFLSILDHISQTKNYEQLLSTDIEYDFRKRETYRLEEIFEYVNNNYDKKITVKDIALKTGLTANSFSRFFKKMTNRRFIDFVNEFRVRKAVDIMNTDSVTVSEIMYLSGYNNLSYFSKQFIKYQGVTPSEHLKMIKSF